VAQDTLQEQRRNQVLDAAVQSIAAHGVHGVRLRDIAREAGVSVGLLQHYFDSREALIESAFERSMLMLLDRTGLSADGERDPWGRIEALLDTLFEAPDLEIQCAIWTEVFAAARVHDHLKPVLDRIYDAWRDVLESAVRDGVQQRRFRPLVPIEDIVTLLLTSIDGWELAVSSGVATASPGAMRDGLLRATAHLLGYDESADR
jgi:AcrR family transcriptional regulator